MDPFGAPPVVYLLALTPALLWGFEPVVSKRGLSLGGTPLQAALVVVVVDASLYWVALFVRGGPRTLTGVPTDAIALFAVAGVVGTALGRIAVFEGVRRVGASVNSAVVSARPLFATALAFGVLGETVRLTTVAGVVVLVAGLAVLSFARGGDVEGWETRELAFPVAAACFFAVGNVLRRFGLRTGTTDALEAVAINETAALVLVAAYVLGKGARTNLRASPRTYGLFAVSGVITAGGLLSLFLALEHPAGRVAVVDPLVATAPLFTAAFAAALLSDLERVTRGVVGGAALVVVGAALVAV